MQFRERLKVKIEKFGLFDARLCARHERLGYYGPLRGRAFASPVFWHFERKKRGIPRVFAQFARRGACTFRRGRSGGKVDIANIFESELAKIVRFDLWGW